MGTNENENDSAQVYLLGKTYLANNQGQFYIKNDPILHMAAGDRHTIIVTESGRAFAFGDNTSGQLGLGNTSTVEKVSCIKSLKFGDTGERVILAACGRESSLVATNRGSLYAFGSNSRSQLGFETSDSTLNQNQPVKIEYFKGKTNWKQISMGAEHACALTEDGAVYVWGSNDEGQCGQGKKIDVLKKPQELRMAAPVAAISCGYYHTALVTENGQLFVLGNNDDRQLGRTIADKFAGPESVSIPNKVVAVACGHQHTVVLTDKGEAYVSGLGDRGQLGLGSRVFSSELFERVPGLPKRVTAIAAGEAHTAVLGNRHDMYIFGDGKHGKLGSATYSNEFEPCLVEKFKNYNVYKVVCGGCQTIVLAQKKKSDAKKSSGSEEEIGNATISITQRPKSLARSMRNKNITDRSSLIADSMDSTIQHARPLGKPNTNLRIESDDDKSEKELSESLKSATFNQTHTITNGRFRPTQSPTLNRTSFRSSNNNNNNNNNDDDLRPLKTGALDRTVRLNKDTDDLSKTRNRLPALDNKLSVRSQRSDRTSPSNFRKQQDSDEDADMKPAARNARFERTSPLNPRKKQQSDEEDKGSSDEQPRSSRKKPEQPTSIRNERKRSPISRSPSPARNDRKPSPRTRRRNESESEDEKPRRTGPVKSSMSETLNRKAKPQKRSDDDDDEEEESPRKSSRPSKQPPPVATRRGSLPPQTRSGASSLPREGNQTIGSKPVDGVRGSFRAPATKTLAKPNTNNDTAKKDAPSTQQPGFFSRLFGLKSTPTTLPPPPPPTPAASTTATANPSSRTCSIM